MSFLVSSETHFCISFQLLSLVVSRSLETIQILDEDLIIDWPRIFVIFLFDWFAFLNKKGKIK